MSSRQRERQRRLRTRGMPLAIAALVAFIAGAISAAGSPEEEMGERFVEAWADQDFAAMHEELTDGARRQNPLDKFAAAYQEAQAASTATAIDPGDAGGSGGEVTVDVGVRTELFGLIEGEVRLPVEGERIAWSPHLVFPDLERGERVGRRLELPDRAPILAKNGIPLAEGQGSSRSSRLGGAAIDVAGEVGTPDAELRGRVERSGYPGDQETG